MRHYPVKDSNDKMNGKKKKAVENWDLMEDAPQNNRSLITQPACKILLTNIDY